MKVCKQCQKALTLSAYYIRKNGIPYTMCKDCYNADKKRRNTSRIHTEISTKTCRRCKQTKGVDEFYVNYSQVGGVGSICKDCSYLANLETKYKIANIDELIAERNGLCDICKQPFGSKPNIDHDHSCCPTDYTCGKCFRGLLCSSCNFGLGNFKDNTLYMSNAVSYVSSYNSNSGVLK